MRSGTISLEYCALRLLVQWLAREKSLWLRIKNNPSNDDIREALGYFMVARTFPGMAADPGGISSKIGSQFIATQNSNFDAVRKVESLADKFKSAFGKRNVSAASKLLWLAGRADFVIYDQRALDALKAYFGAKIPTRNYEKYEQAWRSEFDEHDDLIRRAAKKLPKARAFVAQNSLSNTQLQWFSTQRWFRERVFDIYLWEIGRYGSR